MTNAEETRSTKAESIVGIMMAIVLLDPQGLLHSLSTIEVTKGGMRRFPGLLVGIIIESGGIAEIGIDQETAAKDQGIAGIIVQQEQTRETAKGTDSIGIDLRGQDPGIDQETAAGPESMRDTETVTGTIIAEEKPNNLEITKTTTFLAMITGETKTPTVQTTEEKLTKERNQTTRRRGSSTQDHHLKADKEKMIDREEIGECNHGQDQTVRHKALVCDRRVVQRITELPSK